MNSAWWKVERLNWYEGPFSGSWLSWMQAEKENISEVSELAQGDGITMVAWLSWVLALAEKWST